ncbi:MAG TPA: hypothetical protein VGE66_12960 [Chitinophagaceae bacterium]
MPKYTIIAFLLLFTLPAAAQKLGQVTFQGGRQLSHFSILTDQDILIRISPEGGILEWGTEVRADFANYYAPNLQPFMGRVEYYGAESVDSIFQGKVKSIGTAYFTYYGSHEEEQKRGKLKTIGMLQFDYYSRFDEKALQGKLRWVGNLALDYYRSYEDEAVRGKLKSIGNMPVTYYTAFDDKFNAGKLKSIGSIPYAWYSQYDQGRGALKSNSYRQTISGIMMIVQ